MHASKFRHQSPKKTVFYENHRLELMHRLCAEKQNQLCKQEDQRKHNTSQGKIQPFSED